MTDRPSILPPTSTALERALEQASARIGDIEVSAGGLAMAQGAAGDMIRVQNLTTKRILTGRVQADKSVLVLNHQGG